MNRRRFGSAVACVVGGQQRPGVIDHPAEIRPFQRPESAQNPADPTNQRRLSKLVN